MTHIYKAPPHMLISIPRLTPWSFQFIISCAAVCGKYHGKDPYETLFVVANHVSIRTQAQMCQCLGLNVPRLNIPRFELFGAKKYLEETVNYDTNKLRY